MGKSAGPTTSCGEVGGVMSSVAAVGGTSGSSGVRVNGGRWTDEGVGSGTWGSGLQKLPTGSGVSSTCGSTANATSEPGSGWLGGGDRGAELAALACCCTAAGVTSGIGGTWAADEA